MRAWFVDGLSYQEAGQRFGYARWALVDLVRQYRAGRLDLFAPPRRPGPPPGTAPARDAARGRVIELRRRGLSTYEISARLSAEHTPLRARPCPGPARVTGVVLSIATNIPGAAAPAARSRPFASHHPR